MPPSNKAEFETTDSGCIVVTNRKLNKDGYYRVSRKGKGYMFHRLAYEKRYGQIPEGFEVNHKCGNRACCNTDHLETLSNTEHRVVTNYYRSDRLALQLDDCIRAELSPKEIAYRCKCSESTVYRYLRSKSGRRYTTSGGSRGDIVLYKQPRDREY